MTAAFYDPARSLVIRFGCMYDQLRDDLSQSIEAMSERWKLQLIEELARSIRGPTNGASEAELVKRKREVFRKLQNKIAALPQETDPCSHLGYSNDAHDKILYDIQQK